MNSRHWKHFHTMIGMPPVKFRTSPGSVNPEDSPACAWIKDACGVTGYEAGLVFTHYVHAGLLTFSKNTGKWAGIECRLRMARRKVKKSRSAVISLPDGKNPSTGRTEPPEGRPITRSGDERNP